MAATTATFRVVSDMHYASDALLGALVGTMVGYGVPLLHYSRLKSANAGSALSQMQVAVVPSAGGVGLVGTF